MVNIVTVHSAREGTGKSTIVANIAVLLAAEGQRVGIIDANLQVWSMHLMFGLSQAQTSSTFNDYLLGLCDSSQVAYDVTPPLNAFRAQRMHPPLPEQVFLVPASAKPRDLERVLSEGYSVELITDGLCDLARQLNLDTLLIDTQAGLHDEILLSLLSMAISDTVAVVLRLDQRDHQGTSVTVEVARTLGVPRVALVVNQVVSVVDVAEAQTQVEQVYNCEVAAVLPHIQEIAVLGSTGIFVLHYPDHPATSILRHLALALGG